MTIRKARTDAGVLHSAMGFSVDIGLNRLRNKDDCGLRKEGPGLKPLVFALFFVGLKPYANP
jgi:hypothetical protein